MLFIRLFYILRASLYSIMTVITSFSIWPLDQLYKVNERDHYYNWIYCEQLSGFKILFLPMVMHRLGQQA